MFKFIITLTSINFVVIICADPITVNNQWVKTQEGAKQLLKPIQRGEALPVVFVQKGGIPYELVPPVGIHQVVIENGRMVKGTKFFRKGSRKQIFFCPEQNSDKQCLAPKEFKNLDVLQCPEEPSATVRQIQNIHPECGFQGRGISYSMAYEICERPLRQRHRYSDSSELKIFQFCYDHTKQKTLFTTHFILSPRLLKSHLLFREQDLEYPYTSIDSLQISNLAWIQNSIDLESTSQNYSRYQVQKLVPGEDMALGTWKKPTYQHVNIELQYRPLFHFWNEINDKVREEAKRVIHDDIRFSITTGVFGISSDIPQVHIDGQLYNMWVKMIVSIKTTNDDEEQAGVVILMNNFIDYNIANPALQRVQEKLEGFCQVDLCTNNFKNRIRRISGRMRCCMITPQIETLFGPLKNPNLPVLQIPELIKTQD